MDALTSSLINIIKFKNKLCGEYFRLKSIDTILLSYYQSVYSIQFSYLFLRNSCLGFPVKKLRRMRHLHVAANKFLVG